MCVVRCLPIQGALSVLFRKRTCLFSLTWHLVGRADHGRRHPGERLLPRAVAKKFHEAHGELPDGDARARQCCQVPVSEQASAVQQYSRTFVQYRRLVYVLQEDEMMLMMMMIAARTKMEGACVEIVEFSSLLHRHNAV